VVGVYHTSHTYLTPDSGLTIQASDFTISGAQPATALPPTFTGGTLPAEVDFVKFEDTDNQVYNNYTDPNGTDPNPNYDPNWIATSSNTIVVIVALHPFSMPANNLLLEIDIDGGTTQPVPVVNNVTLT